MPCIHHTELVFYPDTIIHYNRGTMKNYNRLTIPLLAFFFFLSGCAGLIYESIWSHYLKLFVGHAAYAQALVLVIYMGGMALGSWLAARCSSKMRELLVGYALIEIVIGITALFFHPIFVGYLSVSYDSVMPSLGSSLSVTLYKWVTAPLLILPQTVLLGATFPMMTGGIIRVSGERPGRTISVLYFVNSLGGAVGVLLSGFYLIGKCTFPGTVRFAGILDIIVGTGVLLLWFFIRRSQDAMRKNEKKKGRSENTAAAVPVPIDNAGRVMLLIAALTAASSFMYEVGWTRMLSLVLGSSTHSFELMLSAFILGIAIGGFWIRKRADSVSRQITMLAVIQVVMGAFAVATLFFYSNLFYLMRFFMASLDKTGQGYIMFHLYSHLICLLLMLPATVPAGMTLPLITAFLYRRNSDEAMIGRVYASNTVGSIIGVLLAVQVLLPFAGLKALLIIGGSIDMAVGILLVLRFREKGYETIATVFASVMVAVVTISSVGVRLDPTLLSSGVYRYGEIFRGRPIVYYRDGKTSSVAVRKAKYGYQLVNNGKTDASAGYDTAFATPDEYTQILLAAYPLVYAETCDRTAIIGLGSGMTASVLLQSDSVKTLDVIEIERCVVDGAKCMGPKVQKVFNDPRSTIHIDDAKTFFSSQRRTYDLIISEPSNPWVSGVASLFTLEFFDLVAKHLSEHGLLVQWFHLYEMSPDLIASIIMTIDRKFSDYRAFVSGTDMIVLASNAPIRQNPLDPAVFHPKLASSLKQIRYERPYDFSTACIGGRRALSALAGVIDIPINSDYNPVLDLRAVKARITEAQAQEYAFMNSYIIPVRRIIEGDTLAVRHDASGRHFDSQDNNIFMLNADYQAWQAWRYVTSLGTTREADVDKSISRNVALKVAMLRMAANDSSVAAHQMLPKYIIDLLKITMPYLPSAQMRDIWAFIDTIDLRRPLPPKVRDVQTVLRNVSLGEDDSVTRDLCLQLLGKGEVHENEYNRMAAIAYLVASVRLGTFEGVQEVWNRLGGMRYNFNSMMAYNCAYAFRNQTPSKNGVYSGKGTGDK